MIGKSFGPYKIESKLGEGGMGVVYRAMDTDLDRPVAIKTLLDESGGGGSDGGDSVARFMREAKAASRLQHPAIMTIYQFGVEEGLRYLVMEYIDGKTLKKMIAGRPLSVGEMVDIAIQVADGLALAHEKGVVHRDLKPENVMVTARGQVKILDFGLAKLHEEAKPVSDETEVNYYKTTVGTVLGTVSNMSPEQARGEVVDAKSDVFALGILMYEMGCGRNPFIAPTAQATMANILTKEPELISELNPAISSDLERLIHLCLRKRPSERPSANEVVSELKRIQTTLSTRDLQPAETAPAGYGSGTGFSTQPQAPPVSASGSKLQLDSGSRIISRSPSGSAARVGWTKSGTIPRIREIYYLIKTMRVMVQWMSLAIPFSFFFYMMVSGGLIRAQVVEGTTVFAFVKGLVVPVLEFTEKVFTFRPVIEGWNLMLAGLGLVAFAVRHLFLLPFEQAEHWAKTKYIRSKAPAQRAGASGSADRGVSERLSLLREYSDAQRTLSQGKRHLAFLSIDVVSSTKMKQGEDQLVIEHAFAEWRKFIERILRTSNCWKVAFTPDGIMCAFLTARDAKRAGQAVLNELPWFNDGVHRLRTPFSVRCGIHVGEVIFPEEKAMEEVTDEVIDVAGHMQKYANPDSLWVSREVLHELDDADKEGFFQVDRDVDNRITYEWRAYETQ
jgi:serine/threonine protein kinase/class 3 adenylate cyclase